MRAPRGTLLHPQVAEPHAPPVALRDGRGARLVRGLRRGRTVGHRKQRLLARPREPWNLDCCHGPIQLQCPAEALCVCEVALGEV